MTTERTPIIVGTIHPPARHIAHWVVANEQRMQLPGEHETHDAAALALGTPHDVYDLIAPPLAALNGWPDLTGTEGGSLMVVPVLDSGEWYCGEMVWPAVPLMVGDIFTPSAGRTAARGAYGHTWGEWDGGPDDMPDDLRARILADAAKAAAEWVEWSGAPVDVTLSDRRRGRPSTGEVVAVRIPDRTLTAVDVYAEAHGIARPKAIRALIEAGLHARSGPWLIRGRSDGLADVPAGDLPAMEPPSQ